MKNTPLIDMINPVGSLIRVDEGGSGHYRASRIKTTKTGSRVKYRHEGTDYVCKPGQKVRSPVTGIIVRKATPYDAEDYSGVLIEAKRIIIKMFYLKLDEGLIGRVVQMGQPIGTAQDISKKYPLVTPHIHVQITRCDPEVFLGPTDVMEE